MGQISCVTITTLVVVSLANLLLLLTVVLESRRKCSENSYDVTDHLRHGSGKKLMSLVTGRAQDEAKAEHMHMAALCIIKYNRVLLICGTTIVSRYWVLTAGHCCELVKPYPLDKVKVSANSAKWKEGVAHDVEAVMIHPNYTRKTVSHNLCLIKVRNPFVDSMEVPIPLAGSRYKYVANTTATTMGWSSRDFYDSDELYSTPVVLVPFTTCRSINNLNIDETMVCAKNLAKLDCSYDSGGPLFQNHLVVGVVSFETDCASADYPRVYTRMAYFEKWIGQVEDARGEKIGASSDSMSEEDVKGVCEVCRGEAERRCSACKLVFYCSAEHQKEHWKEHRDACRPYEVCSSGQLGRYLKAKRDLHPSDVIFIDSPLVFGPKPHRIAEGAFPCVGCCRLLDDQTCARCPCCFWPVCSLDCTGLKTPQLHGFECNVLKLKPPGEAKTFYDCYRFDVLIILRALYLQKFNGKKWECMLSLQDHLKDRGPATKVFKSVQEKCSYLQSNYLQHLKKYEEETGQCVIPDVSDELIHKIYGILDVNATELSEEIDACVLYPTASLLEHNCTPNTVQIIDDKDGFKVTFRAALPIRKDEHITSIYTHILWGTTARRHHLKKTKYFVCTCRRCQDPSEFGTYINALRCLGTEKEPCGGLQLPLNPTHGDCLWLCNKCNIKLPNKEIMKFVHHLSGEVDKLMARDPKVDELEDMLGKLLNFLHPNHYLVYSVKHTLVQLYGAEDAVEPSDAILNEKLKMCQELIRIAKTIDPGNARLCLYLGVLLNEQFQAEFKLLQRRFESDRKNEFADSVKEIVRLTGEGKATLKYEKNSAAGAKLFEVMCRGEDKLKEWMEENGF
ncbi:hypothetical protein NQ315_001551 [Exocentrus adspersus]|uniref:Protein msta n=1 Tax=Exocentrus adspersus TaxID=1586481 RepID=A0AAV8W8K9_9CUCU|nr:hypothetical protein NQ315_001551 [Exocentrus adspersus]